MSLGPVGDGSYPAMGRHGGAGVMAFGGTTSCCIPGFTVAINYKSSHPLRKNTHSTRKLLHVHCVTTPNTYTRISIENLNPSYVGVVVKPTQSIFNPPPPPHNHSNSRFGGREANTIDIQSTNPPHNHSNSRFGGREANTLDIQSTNPLSQPLQSPIWWP